MRRTTLYILIFIFAFVIEVALATFGVVRRYLDLEDKAISCSSIYPARYTTIKSTILKDSDSSWRYDEMTTTGKESLHDIQFININEGWIGGAKGALYKTTNAGRDWQKIPLDISSESDIVSISFVNSSTGWLVARLGDDTYWDKNTVKSWVLNTTDGGKTWQTQYQVDGAGIDRVQFVNQHEGWAIGNQVPFDAADKGLLIRTTDGGQHWTNLSANISEPIYEKTGTVVNILAAASSKATVLKSTGRLYSTDDGGQTWAQVGSVPDDSSQAFLGQFDVMGGNRMWAIGGADSREGMWGTLARMDTDCYWRKYSIGGVYFADATFVSENEVFACGTIPCADNEDPCPDRNGLIMNSTDGGANWKIVYRSPGKHFRAITRVGPRNIWAISSGGVIVHLQPKYKL